RGRPGTWEALSSPRHDPSGHPGDQAQDPGRRAPLAWERRASPARYGPVKVTKRGRTEAGSRSIAQYLGSGGTHPRTPWREGGAGVGIVGGNDGRDIGLGAHLTETPAGSVNGCETVCTGSQRVPALKSRMR